MANTRKCSLCGKNFVCTKAVERYSSYCYGDVVAYMERGLSQKYFLCFSCYDNKIVLNDYSADEKKRNSAVAGMQKIISNKSSTIQDIVHGWIDGAEKNYYPEIKDLIYYVEGPEASLFVFNDHLTILSSYEWTERRYTNMPDYVMFYKCRAHVSERKISEVKNFFSQYQDDYKLSDLDKINGNIDVEKIKFKYGIANPTIELNISLGDYGTLLFANKWSFKFYYHQNQLMEEVYNYICKQAASVEPEQKVVENDVGQVGGYIMKSSSKTIEKPAEDSGASFSAADEIRKMKELFDCGIITQEEFDEAKKRLISKL